MPIIPPWNVKLIQLTHADISIVYLVFASHSSGSALSRPIHIISIHFFFPLAESWTNCESRRRTTWRFCDSSSTWEPLETVKMDTAVKRRTKSAPVSKIRSSRRCSPHTTISISWSKLGTSNWTAIASEPIEQFNQRSDDGERKEWAGHFRESC